MLTAILAAAALTVAAAALTLAIVVMRQNATTTTTVRRTTRAVRDIRDRVDDLLDWSTDVHRAVFPDQQIADDPPPEQSEQLEQPDPPATAHLERHDLPTTAMPAADRPAP